MLKHLAIRGFKSLAESSITVPRLAVLFGPPAAGTSNLLDAVQTLSRLGTCSTLADALAEPTRGYPIDAFTLPAGGLPELLDMPQARFSLEADLTVGTNAYRYRVDVAIEPRAGRLSIADEYLAQRNAHAMIQSVGPHLHIRRKSTSTHPRQEPLGLDHTIVSDPRFGGMEYHALEQTRHELSGWRTYTLDPDVAMRVARPPADVQDIGVRGEAIAPFLYRLRRESPKHFQAVVRTLRSLVPDVDDLAVDLDPRRGTLDIRIRQSGIDTPWRIVSSGTLRVLALCAVAVNPWGGSLLAFDEPDHGVHPRRITLMAQLLVSLALEQGRQLVVTTHAPLLCDAVLHHARSQPTDIGLFIVRRVGGTTTIAPLDPRFTGQEHFDSLMLRGFLDA